MDEDLQLPAIGAGSGPPDAGGPAHQCPWYEEAEGLDPYVRQADPAVAS